MDTGSKLFITGIVVVDLLAVVYFGGRWITTGSPIPLHHGAHEEHIVVAHAQKPADAGHATPEAVLPPPFDYAAYAADATAGAKLAAKCKACHTFDQGGAHRTGPNLWGVYNKPIASSDGFAYSGGMTAMQGQWDDEHLMAFLKNPRGYVAGTKMQFNGIKKPDQRADLIAWLKTLK